jgi:hypothetical protein
MGSTHLLFEPARFLEKLVTFTPRPEINLAHFRFWLSDCGNVPGVLVGWRATI